MIINQEDVMYIIAGLGNPGKEYMGTRHNAGFSVIDELADKYNISVDTAKHKGLIGKGVIAGQKVILVKPMTYMNNSGEVRHFTVLQACFLSNKFKMSGELL